MTTTHNHVSYQARLDFVQSLLRKEFNIKSNAEIAPIQYEPDFPFKYNNFVYRVTLPTPTTSSQATATNPRPGCAAIPENTKEVIVRLANPDADGMHRSTRVENEVAITSLAAAALKDFHPHIVPSVYAWGSAAGESTLYGWAIQELLPGVSLDEAFSSMKLEQKKHILAQMAKILKTLQEFELPESITAFGGVTFDEEGRIVSAAMPTVGEGPWGSYEASFRARIAVALRKADENPHIRGWRENGIRERVDAFVERGLSAQFEGLDSKGGKCIVHADFNASNLLFDPSTHLITGLIDYDFSSIMHPSYEYLRSFLGVGGQFRGWCGDQGLQEAALTEARLHGFPSPLPESSDDDGGVNWELAKALDEELTEAGARRPRTMKGIEKVADVDTVLRTILPWRLSNADVLKLQSEEVLGKCRRENEVQFVKLLDYLGF